MKKYLLFIFCLLFVVIGYCGKKSKSDNSISRDRGLTASSSSSSSKNSTKPTFLYFPNSDAENSTQSKTSTKPERKISDNHQLPNSSSKSTSSNTKTTSVSLPSKPKSISTSSSSVSSYSSFAKSDTFSVGDKITLVSDDIVSENTHKLVFKHHCCQDDSKPREIIIEVTESKYTDDFCETFDGQGALLGTINGKELYIYLDNNSYPNKIFTGIFIGANYKNHKSKNCIYYGSLDVLKLYSYKFEKNNVD